MPHPKLYALVLAGGSGTRLWPLSRKELPKQFLCLEGESTLFQNTLLRLLKIVPSSNIKVISADEWSSLINHQAKETGCRTDMLINEPAGRNTAPAIALGIAYLIDNGASKEDIAIVCPSDHIITDTEAFEAAVKTAINAATSKNIVTFGITPSSPETGFGYIKTGAENTADAFNVLEFVEKPDIQTAKQYLEAGNYYWNSGIFCFKLGDMLESLVEFFPECGIPARTGFNALKNVFSSIPSISIDYAVMENASNVVCVPLNAGWSDIGSWDSVWENLNKDESNNVKKGDTILKNVKNSLIMASERLITVTDLEDVIVVDTLDAVYITKKGNSQKVRDIVKELRDKNRLEVDQAPLNTRPWGTYKIISQNSRDKVKRIQVMPGKRLSLQFHNHRSEHWIVVKGTAKVTIIDKIFTENNIKKELILNEGESCFVMKGNLHRLENPGNTLLEIIEVQTGDYLGEDDIVRVEDDFKR